MGRDGTLPPFVLSEVEARPPGPVAFDVAQAEWRTGMGSDRPVNGGVTHSNPASPAPTTFAGASTALPSLNRNRMVSVPPGLTLAGTPNSIA